MATQAKISGFKTMGESAAPKPTTSSSRIQISGGCIVPQPEVEKKVSVAEVYTGSTQRFSGRARSMVPITPGPFRSLGTDPYSSSRGQGPSKTSSTVKKVPEKVESSSSLSYLPETLPPANEEGEIDVTSVITGPTLKPFEDFVLESQTPTHRAAVILFPKGTDPAFSFADKDFCKRMYFMATKYKVFGFRVANLEEASEKISEVIHSFHNGGHSVQHLELGGHGTSTSISWPEQDIRVNCCDFELSLLFSMLEPESSILCLSCQNGRPTEGENMGEYLARVGLGHKIFTTTCDIGPHLDLKVNSALPFDVKYTLHGKDVTAIYKF